MTAARPVRKIADGVGTSRGSTAFDARASLPRLLHAVDGHEIVTSPEAEDDAWDAFLGAAGAHYAQTSLWRRVKDATGWGGVRLVVRADGEIVGGVQIFVRQIPVFGGVAYAPKGPVVDGLDAGAVDALVESVQSAMSALHVRYLLFEPPALPPELERSLAGRSFAPAALTVGPRATLLLAVHDDEEQLLLGMKPRTRYNIRLAARKEIAVREGSADDLSVFYRLLQSTGRRQGFRIYPERYFRRLWHVLGSKGHAKLFVAAHRGVPVSAQLAIAFGTTVTNKLTVWSGEHAGRKPNEAVHWAAIRWAGAAGFERYDFEGIDSAVARTLADGGEPGSDQIPSVTAFKLGFGGDVRLEPQAFERLSGPVLRFAYENSFARVTGNRHVRRAVSSLRTRGRPHARVR